jgi:hypothetical protein
MSSTANIPENYLDRMKIITISSKFKGRLIIPYDVHRETRRQENMIANRGLPLSRPTTTSGY